MLRKLQLPEFRSVFPVALALVLLLLTSQYSFLLFHSLAEILSLVIIASIYLFIWNTRQYTESHCLYFLGTAMVFVGWLDLLHMLTFTGMAVIPGSSTNLSDQFWVAARYVQCAAFLIAPLFIDAKFKPLWGTLAFAAVTLLAIASILIWHIFPAIYVVGDFTRFKVLSDLVETLVLFLAIAHLWRYRNRLDGEISAFVLLSLVLTLLAVLSLSFYVAAFELSSILGHLFKLLALFALYRAIVIAGITRTFSNLVNELTTREAELQKVNLGLEEKVNKRAADLLIAKHQLEIAYDQAILGWVSAIEVHDHDTLGHSLRVAKLFEKLARYHGMSETLISDYFRGALLHDIGKIGIPDEILQKPSALTSSERKVMERHPEIGYHMLANIEYLRPALTIPYCHHEKWDGSGYPRRLRGAQIPLEARLFAVADVWDAVTSERPYRHAWSPGMAREYIKGQAGKHFDPKVVSEFMDILDEGVAL